MHRLFTGLKLTAKISLFGVGIVLVTAVALMSLAVWQSGLYNRLAQNEVESLIEADLDHITHGVYTLVQTENETASLHQDSSGASVGRQPDGARRADVQSRVRLAIVRTMVGKSGYVYVLGGTGDTRGHYIVSQNGERDGENIWDSRDEDGRWIIREIVAMAVGLKAGELATVRYRWQNPGEPAARWKVARLAYFEPWDWVIGTSVYEDELQGYRAILSGGRQRMVGSMGAAGMAIAVLIGFLGVLAAWTIVKPVRRMTAAVQTISQGDLDQVVDVSSRDEIGTLARTFTLMTGKLKKSMQGLRMSEERYRGIFENAIEGFFQSSIEGIFLTVNPSMAAILGYDSPEQLLAQITDIRQQLYARPEDRDEMLAELRAGKTCIGREVQFIRKDGSLIWVSLSDRLIRNETGKTDIVQGFLFDITERKRAEEEMLAANERFRSVLRASIGHSIIGTDTDGVIKVFNEGAERLLGYGASEVIDRVNVRQIYDSDAAAQRAAELGIPTGFDVFVSAARRGETETREWTYVNKDCTRRTVAQTVTAMRAEDGGLTGFIAIARDITAERKLEAQLLQSRKMESIGLLAGGVAHDFNNLLTPILGYAEMLLSDVPADAPSFPQLEEIRKAAESARDLTRRLLTFSRKQMIVLQTIDLGQTIRRFESILRRTIQEHIDIVVEISPSLGTIRADAVQIEQVLINLSINAQDSMPDGGVLTIEAADIELDESYAVDHPGTAPGPYVMLAVSDTGAGMDQETLERIFEPFFTTKELGRGTGLGLSTVYGIITQHGGAISVYSEKQRGSTFKVFLPRVTGLSGENTRETSSPDGLSHGNERILVVEDNERVRTLACRMLERLGYRVFMADDVDRCRAIAEANRDPIDLLLTDVVMPTMNGRELYDLLRQGRPDLKVLFMSGYPSNVIGHHGVLDEGVQFIQKPFTLRALSAGIRRALDG
jgi:PAS domain S-box-containing protein